jgi:hypothetical protein
VLGLVRRERGGERLYLLFSELGMQTSLRIGCCGTLKFELDADYSFIL